MEKRIEHGHHSNEEIADFGGALCVHTASMSANMEESEMIALRWNNHPSTMTEILSSMREEARLADVTLACEGKTVLAHKIILAMCSDYFKTIFTNNTCSHPVVFLKDVHYEELESLLDFIYRGVVQIRKAALTSLLKTADSLQIRGLNNIFAQETIQHVDGLEVVNTVTVQQPQQQPPPPPPQQQTPNSLPPNTGNERLSLTGLEPTVFLSPDRKRSYDVNQTLSNNPDGTTSSLGNFSESELEEHSVLSANNTVSQQQQQQPPPQQMVNQQNQQHIAIQSPMKKHAPQRIMEQSPSSAIVVPDLPKLSENRLDIGHGIAISSSDYNKLRRTNANRYINDLLRYFFSLEVLAMSSLTGGECFANRGKTQSSNKNQLDPTLIRVITNDALRNFPMITEKQVRNAIRRKLNTESRTYRGLGKVSTGMRRSTPAMKRRSRQQTPRAMVSIDRSNISVMSDVKPMMISEVKPMMQQQQQMTPNFTVDKNSINMPMGAIFRSKDLPNLNTGLVNRGQLQQQTHQTQQYVTQQSVSGITVSSQGLSLAVADKQRSPEEEDVNASAVYFNSSTPAPTSRGMRCDRSPPPPHHTPTPNSGTPPLGLASNLPPSSSPSTSITDNKSFNLVKTEVGNASTQYISNQDYSNYLTHVTSQPSYLTHHISADSPYLRRLEPQGTVQHSTTSGLSYTYPTLPTSESMESSLHM